MVIQKSFNLFHLFLKTGNIVKSILLVVFLLVYIDAQAQDKKKLEQSKQKLENQIGYTRKLLNETASKKKSSLNELSLLTRQIKNRQELIEVLNREIDYADAEINKLNKEIDNLKIELTQLKEEYAHLVYQSYKSRNQVDQWMYIFSSTDFYQAYARIKYIKAIGQARKEAADRIIKKQKELNDQILYFQQVKKNRLDLLTSKEQEARSLINDKSKQEESVKDIVKKERELKQQLAQQQKEWNSLNEKIKKLIESAVKSKTNAKTQDRIPLTPEEKLLAESFAGNKGKLPWPSERGQITSSFGAHAHPQLHVTIDNKGIDLRTEQGAKARAVFDGKVYRIIQLGKFKAILVQHGSYFTVYSNLSDVYVTEGDHVKTKQELGVVGTAADSGETILHFELWNAKTNSPQNPEFWII